MSGSSAVPKYPGTPVTIAGVSYVMPAMLLSTRNKIKAAQQALVAGAQGYDEDSLVVEVLTETLVRNYPGLTAEKLTDGATFAEDLMPAYLTLQLEEARRLAELGKRMQAQMLALSLSPSTTSSLPSSVKLAEAGSNGSESSISPG